MDEITIVDNFFKNVDDVRNYALNLNYRSPIETEGWKGYRSADINSDLYHYIKNKLIEKIPGIYNLTFNFYFHYCLEKTKFTFKQPFNKYKIHKDPCLFAGVIYLNPCPKENSGTSFYDADGNEWESVDNVYNRLVFYPSSFLHGITDFFGENIESSRLTLTIFLS